ncbi:peroxiredoxin-like family protein [Sediminimonas qiaohouensis]|uniref:peroxiredoxin-like family protein n=1 Tax=Sediminimonas qiaohouensis TaxID=552061 RepID=UPI00041DA88C|nr:peroxiredoxin-like family protein [Sediminimonas qiaohouensis]
MNRKLESGQLFPNIPVARLGSGELVLGQPRAGHDWQLVVVYRGKHCPLCRKYLSTLENLQGKFHDIGIDVVVVSGDPEEKARDFAQELGLSMPVGYGLSIAQMQELGLYVSHPRSPEETDRPFPEPGTFVINADGALQLVDISNAPFARPDLEGLAGGLAFIRSKNYPIRGTYAA